MMSAATFLSQAVMHQLGTE